ncbi:ABC transporter permease [Martelella alba]|uniref:ABC transporter permease n=1 Tax=Martelella alba TaxID=2590451 RepID=A0A506UB53_9HYPH|nr:FtsX-like permease family protein [Martelella alba]TPW30768.1 ABC transporter permease [Martelella alba]
MLRFIAADLKRLWAGSLVIILLVTLATALGVTVTLSERALRLGSARASEKFDLIIGAPGSETQLVLSSVFLQAADLPLMPGHVLTDLASNPQVDWAAPIGFGDSYQSYPIVGTTSALISATTPGFISGGMFAHEGEAVIGAAVNLPLGAEIKPMHGDIEHGGHTHSELAYHVTGKAGFTGTAWDRAIMVPIRAVWDIHGLEEEHENEADHPADGAHEDEHHEIDSTAPLDEDFSRAEPPGLPAILVKPKTIADAYKLRQSYREDHETLAVFPAEVLTKLYATMGDARRVLSAIAIGAQLLVAAALMMVTVIHIAQRRRQIGALRAFGAPRGAVFTIVWSELFALVGTGILLGYGAGFCAARMIADSIATERGFALPVSFEQADFAGIATVLAVAALLSALPALMAYRQPPAAALRA